jgi:hypothetical protein
MAPAQYRDHHVKDFIEQAEADDWLRVAYIPGGLTSLLQVCDLVCNKDLKAMIKSWYQGWKIKALKQLPRGQVKLPMPRDEFVVALEDIFRKYNAKERSKPTIKPCFKKVGMDIFNDDMEPFKAWLKNLASHHVYKTLADYHLEQARGVELDTYIEMGVALLEIENEEGDVHDCNDPGQSIDSGENNANSVVDEDGWDIASDSDVEPPVGVVGDAAVVEEDVAAAEAMDVDVVAAMDAIVKTLEEEAAEELYLDSVHEATNASHNDGTAFGEVEAITNWAAANLPTDDDADL